MLKTLGRWSLALIVVSAISAVPIAYGSHGSGPNRLVGQVGEVVLDEGVLATPDLIRAFVPTGSKSHRCLVTFGESTIADVLGPSPFCGARTVNGIDGVLITIHLTDEVSDLFLSLTVFQQFAKTFGAPVLYRGT